MRRDSTRGGGREDFFGEEAAVDQMGDGLPARPLIELVQHRDQGRPGHSRHC